MLTTVSRTLNGDLTVCFGNLHVATDPLTELTLGATNCDLLRGDLEADAGGNWNWLFTDT